MSPVAAATDLSAGCKISLGGSDLDPAIAGQLLELRVETTTGLPDVCVLRLVEKSPDGSSELKIIDDPRLKLGALIQVKLAAAIGGSLGPVFDGEITSLEAELGASFSGAPLLELTITAHDRSHRMHQQATERTLRQMTVTDVARKVAAEHGLKVGKLAALPGGALENVHQVGESDWRFLSRLVREHGGELDVEQGTLHIIDPTKSTAAVAELRYGEGLQHFRARVSSLGQVGEVVVRSWDPAKKAVIQGTAKPKASTSVKADAVDAQLGGTRAVYATGRVSTKAAADAQAAAAAARLGHERVQGDATTAGDPVLLAGEYVTVSGVGTRFGGTHRIVSAVHVYGAGGYETRLVLGAGGRPLAEVHAGGASADFPAHLVVGIVTDNNDPDKLGRVKVKFPRLDEKLESGWARLALGAAGKERGAVALPHPNDEVVVGFEHGDATRPFVLGVLHNGRDTPGADLVDAKSSWAARFPRNLDVATQQQLLVDAATGATVKSTKGPLELSANKELKLSASAGGPPSAITIETTGQIKATGKQGVEIAASGPLKITSTAPVTVESNAALQLKGSIVQVQASGILQLSGATVMLG